MSVPAILTAWTISATPTSLIAEIVWTRGTSWPVVAAIAFPILIGVIAGYRREPPGAKQAATASMLLKLLAITLLAVAALGPAKRSSRAIERANDFVLLVDDSQSMGIVRADQSETFCELAIRVFDENASWLTATEETFRLSRYAVADRVRRFDAIADLEFDRESSDLTASLAALSPRLAGRPIAGALLVSDGATTTPIDAPALAELGFPIHVLQTRAPLEVDDRAIAAVRSRVSNFETAPATVEVDVATAGVPARGIVRLSDVATDRVIDEKPISDELNTAKFKFRPDGETDVRFFEATVEGDSGGSDEVTLLNNRRLVMTRRDAGPHRVLYVAGRPNWEFKFLRRAIDADAEVELVGLIRIARKEPKFSFRDNRVTDANPLFEGFETDEETAEAYDQPVMIRLGVEDGEELRDGFPIRVEDLFQYDAVIIDDIEADFFTEDQRLLLRRFVADRGGGLMMLGGAESFGGRDFRRTPLGDLCPITSDGGGDGVSQSRWTLTRGGWLQPWLRLRPTREEDQARIDGMPAFRVAHRFGRPKPGATTLASISGQDGTSRPALVSQRFGRGRVLALAIGDWWRWSMRTDRGGPDRSPANEPRGADQSWRQMVRHLVGDVPGRVALEVDTESGGGAPVRLIAEVRDREFFPADDVDLRLTVTTPEGEVIDVDPRASDRAGSYEATYYPLVRGGYLAKIRATDSAGVLLGEDTDGFIHDPVREEMRRLVVNRETLSSIAAATGGDRVPIADLDRWASELPGREVPLAEYRIDPLWHTPWWLVAALVCLCGDWALRRWRGAA